MAGLNLKGIYKRYDGNNGPVTAVADFNLDIEDKEFIVLVGPSGCGKSTTLRMIAGLEDISEGELYIGDKMMNEVPPKNRDIAMVFQNYALYPHMTVFDNMAFGLKLRKMPKDEITKRVTEAARILDIEHLLDRKPRALSGGQRQRVALGRAIVREPKVFLMDEPLSNLDAKLRGQMRAEISKLHQKLQTTFIYVTHDQTEAMTMGSRIVVMKDGIIQQIDAPQTLYDHPVNMFVGGFIGSPTMDFVEGTLEKKEDGVWFTFGASSVKLPEGRAAKIDEKGYIGKQVVMGVRSENIYDDQMHISASPDSVVKAHVEVTELMGSETLLHLDVEGASFIATVDPRTQAKAGDDIEICFDMNRIHLFDKETEMAILN